MNNEKKEIAEITNHKHIKGAMSQALYNADIFVGVSNEGALKG